MDAKKLIDQLLAHSYELHPEYSGQQHWTWVTGFLATTVCEKNHMDNIIWARIKTRIDSLYQR